MFLVEFLTEQDRQNKVYMDYMPIIIAHSEGSIKSIFYDDTDNPCEHRRFVAIDDDLTVMGVAYLSNGCYRLRYIDNDKVKERQLMQGECMVTSFWHYKQGIDLKYGNLRQKGHLFSLNSDEDYLS